MGCACSNKTSKSLSLPLSCRLKGHWRSGLTLSVQGYTVMTDCSAKDINLSAACVTFNAFGSCYGQDLFCVICSAEVHAHALPACCVSCVRGSTLLSSRIPADSQCMMTFPPALRAKQIVQHQKQWARHLLSRCPRSGSSCRMALAALLDLTEKSTRHRQQKQAFLPATRRKRRTDGSPSAIMCS